MNETSVSTTQELFRKLQEAQTRVTALEAQLAEQERKLAEREDAFRRAEQWLGAFYEGASILFLSVDSNGVIRDCSDSVSGLLGYSTESLSGRNISELFDANAPGQGEPFSWCPGKQRSDVFGEQELALKHRDGSTRWFEVSIKELTDAAGEVDGCCCTLVDVSRLKFSLERKVESEKRYKRLVENASDSIMLTELGGSIVSVNNRCVDSLGYTREEFAGLTVADVVENLDLEEFKQRWGRFPNDTPMYLRRVQRRKDGSTFPVEVCVVKFVEDQPYVLAIVRDITERRAVGKSTAGKRGALSSAVRAVACGNGHGGP